jgi:K+-transporting ATPase KdpF subunit
VIATESYDNWVALALSVGALFYLLAVLIFPERF